MFNLMGTLRKMQIETSMSYYYTPVRTSKTIPTHNAGEDVGLLSYSHMAGEDEAWCSHSEKVW